jgi:lipopolysaccharide/colanic/teichoic acid biosynthesis glycosyltransferase
LDVALSLIGLTLFAPVHALAAIWCRIEDGGPLLFVQERCGQHGRPFRIYKLRTMRAGEVTRLGRWLRATGLDETAQFYNVLRGEMSIVGPRPLTREDLIRLGWQQRSEHPRFALRPGITGLGQLFGDKGARQVLALDALYARRAALPSSHCLDIRLIALSFAINVVGKRRVRRLLRAQRERRRRCRATPLSRPHPNQGIQP